MRLHKELQELTSCNNMAGSFQLTKRWLETVENVELSATAVAVMTALLWHFNPQKKYVYPHQETIAKKVKRSVATVKRALSELKKAGYIVTIRSRSGNRYAFTKKFFELVEPPASAACTIEKANNELSHDHEQRKEQRKNKHADVVFLKDFSKGAKGEAFKEVSSTAAFASSKAHIIGEIPKCLQEKAAKGEIKNLKAYWNSLRPAIREEYREIDKKAAAEAERKETLRKIEAAEKERKAAELEALKEEMKKPLQERWTLEAAEKYIRNSRSFLLRSRSRSGLAFDLAAAFNIDIDEILKGE